MDNNIGPGRILDKLYQFLGRKVEWRILRMSISSLHPNRILQFLLATIDDDDEEYGDYVQEKYHDSYVYGPLSLVIETIYCRKGSVAVTGLKSLVHQAQ